MIRLIVIIAIAAAAFWCYNNFNLANFKVQDLQKNVMTSLENEKTIKAVNQKRAFDYDTEQSVVKNEN